MKRWLLSCMLLISGAAFAAEPMTADQVKNLLAGNSVAGFADALGKNYTAYYAPDGKLIQVLENGKRNEGKWRIADDGHFCTQFPDKEKEERCTRIVPSGNGEYQRVKDDGMVTNTFKKVTKGNTYKH